MNDTERINSHKCPLNNMRECTSECMFAVFEFNSVEQSVIYVCGIALLAREYSSSRNDFSSCIQYGIKEVNLNLTKEDSHDK